MIGWVVWETFEQVFFCPTSPGSHNFQRLGQPANVETHTSSECSAVAKNSRWLHPEQLQFVYPPSDGFVCHFVCKHCLGKARNANTCCCTDTVAFAVVIPSVKPPVIFCAIVFSNTSSIHFRGCDNQSERESARIAVEAVPATVGTVLNRLLRQYRCRLCPEHFSAWY